MADSLPVLISYVDSEQRYRFNNKAYEKWHGHLRKKIYGKHVKDILGKKAYEDIAKHIKSVLSGHEVIYEKLFQYKNVGDRFVRVMYVPDFGEHENVQGFFALVYDITEIVKAKQILRLYAKRLGEIEETLRKRLAQELHDKIGRDLAVLSINLNIVSEKLPDKVRKKVGEHIKESVRLVEETAEYIRDIMAELRPPLLDEYGLVSATNWYAEKFFKQTGISVKVQAPKMISRMSIDVETAFFRIAQEALTNAAKHAQADSLIINIEMTNRIFRMTITDNGKGFSLQDTTESKKQSGWGLINMQERAEAIGGQFKINSSPGKGTQIIVETKV
ncbi:MAG: hypothetical protein A2X59_08985 [Nitrospirae bacterium GWC2_42_7]|nr:MAG: hypothetical protein A2X59_08985 [Nitrospirae bacterium GWC2_42_7]